MNFLRYAIYILVFFLPFEALRLPFDVSLIRVLGIFCICAISLDLVLSIYRNRRLQFKIPIDFWFPFGFLTLAVFSATYSQNVSSGIQVVTNTISLVLMYVFVRTVIRSKTHLATVLLCACLGFLASTALSYLASEGYLPLTSASIIDLRLEQSRFSGFLRNPNRFAFYSLFIFWAAMILKYVLNKHISLAWISMIVSSTLIVLSLSRGVLLALGIAILTWLVLSKSIGDAFKKVSLLAVVYIILTGSGYIEILGTRFALDTLIGSGSSLSRLSLWSEALRMISESPFIGIGLGTLEGVRGQFGGTIHDPHNLYLYFLLYFGILGLIFLVIVHVAIILRILASFGNNWQNAVFALSMFLSALVPGLFHTTLFYKALTLLILMVVLITQRQLKE